MSRRQASAPPKFTLVSPRGSHYVEAVRGVSEATWMSNPEAGTQYLSRYAAKRARELAGMSESDCAPREMEKRP